MLFAGVWAIIKKPLWLHKALLAFMFLSLWLFCGFRNEVGPDWDSYKEILTFDFSFWRIISLQAVKESAVEPLYLLLEWVVKLFNGGINELNIVICLLTLILVFKTVRRLNCFPLLGILIFMAHGYFFLFSQLRQGIAIGLFFYAIPYIQEGNFRKYLICMLLATGFHFSALILIPLYFVLRKRFPYFYIGPFILLAIIFQQIHAVSLILGALVNLTGNPILVKYYELYIVKKLFSGNSTLTTLMVEWLGWLVVLTAFKKRLQEVTPHFNVFYNISWIGLCLYVAFADIAVFARIAGYFRVSFMILLPCILYLMKDTMHKVFFFIIVTIFIFIRWYTPIKTDESVEGNRFVPYRNIILGS
jgi:transmembrane protein EpsG